MHITLFLLLCGIVASVFSEDLVDRHVKRRNELLAREAELMLGSDIVLNEKEKMANDIIMGLKNQITNEGFITPQFYNFSKHFFTYKEEVKKTTLYKTLRDMPKGAVLHAHDTAVLGPDYLVKITYWDNLYVCFEEENMNLLFSKNVPRIKCANDWRLMSEARASSGNVKKFDSHIRKYFSIVIDNPNDVYTDVNTVWSIFMNYFGTSTPLLTYKLAWEHYFYETLKALREENIMYLEIRSILPKLYDLDGNTYSSLDTAASYKSVVDRFVNDYPDFIGAKLIYAPLRNVEGKTVSEYIKIAKEIKARFPDLLAGFDLVGQEDLGVPTKEFIPQLTEAAKDLEFFFHAGETSWNGQSSDENLVDSILLGTRRLGHAYALAKHPLLLEEVIKRDIAVEVNVISNAVLCLVSDIRNHPLATYLARGVPVVISSDDPGPWEADLLTHDYFVTFVGVANKHADLRLLKKLALNSLKYSTVANKEKVIKEFEVRWMKFIDDLLKGVHFEL